MVLAMSPKGVSGKKIKLSRGVSYYEVDRAYFYEVNVYIVEAIIR